MCTADSYALEYFIEVSRDPLRTSIIKQFLFHRSLHISHLFYAHNIHMYIAVIVIMVYSDSTVHPTT